MKRFLKFNTIILLISIYCFGKFAHAQEPQHKFYLNVYHTLRYPNALKDSCTAVYTNLLLDVDGKGKVVDVRLSDSSPEILKNAFADAKNKLKTSLLDDLIQEKKLRNCGILIPVFFVYADDYCRNSFNDKFLENKYMKFDAAQYNKMVFAMPPLIYRMTKPIK